ncbi:ATP-binding protein [Stakelama pacifica]|uniref:Uncharacterized protein DUF87 n=1 Tax=Stakelama pacifica TaxID=517720 RepID=A0A4R6FLS2_9SPHN|nr:type IV secretory system conjugative DNA transfer family protein [Stakelama pacifica]TDN82347.1 uncharacterized protein DUF87 [Stakelama pacifica]
MSKNINLGIFCALAFVLLALLWLHTGKLVPPSGPDAIWFHAGLMALLVGRFIVEYRFTKPNDVFVNCLAVFVSVSTLSNPPNAAWWETLRWSALMIGSVALFLGWDPGREARLENNPWRRATYQIVTRLGRAEVIFSIVFVLALLSYFDVNEPRTRLFAITWALFLLVANLNLEGVIRHRRTSRGRRIIGMAHSLLAPSIVFCRRMPGEKVRLHEVVGFMQAGSKQCHCLGLVIGERSSASETRVAVALINQTVEEADINDRSIMVEVSAKECEVFAARDKNITLNELRRVVGTVARGTNISRIKFEVFGAPAISAGSLLQVKSGPASVYYQVFEGLIDEEASLRESTRAFVEGEAEQVGSWDDERGGFETHDWVARERAPVFLVGEDQPAPAYELKADEITLGAVPRSRYQVNACINDLILYHTGILGVTGSGKSFLTFRLIEEAAAKGVKVVCIDPTGDYQKYLGDAVMLDRKGACRDFLDSADHNIGILETASFSETPIKQARSMASLCLDWCKKQRTAEEVMEPKPKVLIVLEEAHLLIPEWNFNPQKSLQEEVNKTSQIVLQARKYGLGFLIVAQRTANVTKSVLNQCNTMIALQQFDETGFDFLKNYMGAFHVKSLPNLKPRHGILVGKASLSRRPVMVHFSEQIRELREDAAPSMPERPNPKQQAVRAENAVATSDGA